MSKNQWLHKRKYSFITIIYIVLLVLIISKLGTAGIFIDILLCMMFYETYQLWEYCCEVEERINKLEGKLEK